MIRVDRHFRDERRRREELYFDAPFGYEVVGGGDCEEREEGGYGAHRDAVGEVQVRLRLEGSDETDGRRGAWRVGRVALPRWGRLDVWRHELISSHLTSPHLTSPHTREMVSFEESMDCDKARVYLHTLPTA